MATASGSTTAPPVPPLTQQESSDKVSRGENTGDQKGDQKKAPTPSRKPYIGAQVYWWPRSRDPRDPPFSASETPWAAIVVALDDREGVVTLATFNPTGGSIQSRARVKYAESPRASCWTWMDRKVTTPPPLPLRSGAAATVEE